MDRIFNPEARLEFVQASEYFRNISPGLKEAFVAAFEQAMEEIADFPEASPVVEDTIARRKGIKKFPYVIIYTLDPDALYIVAVAHNQREPGYWLHRLDEPGR